MAKETYTKITCDFCRVEIPQHAQISSRHEIKRNGKTIEMVMTFTCDTKSHSITPPYRPDICTRCRVEFVRDWIASMAAGSYEEPVKELVNDA